MPVVELLAFPVVELLQLVLRFQYPLYINTDYFLFGKIRRDSAF